MSTGRRHRVLFAAALFMTACPAPSPATPLGPCTALGAKCQTPAGPLGVCDSVPCADGRAGPCFRCQPQH